MWWPLTGIVSPKVAEARGRPMTIRTIDGPVDGFYHIPCWACGDYNIGCGIWPPKFVVHLLLKVWAPIGVGVVSLTPPLHLLLQG